MERCFRPCIADSVCGVVGVCDRAESLANRVDAELFALPVGFGWGAGDCEGAEEPAKGSSSETTPGMSKSPGVDRIRFAGEFSLWRNAGSSLA